MTDRSRDQVGQYVKSWQPTQPSQTYFTDFAGGGVLYVGASYKWHIFESSGTWTSPVTNADVIVIAGGGGGGSTSNFAGGGGGAGGVRNLIAGTFVVGTAYTVTVGAGGTGGLTATSGGNSSIVTSSTTISATGGGRGMATTSGAAATGGSGGGASANSVFPSVSVAGTGAAGNAGAYSPVEGFAGGNCAGGDGYQSGGGGGGHASAGGLGGLETYGAASNWFWGGYPGNGFVAPAELALAPIFATKTVTDVVAGVDSVRLSCAWGGQGAGYLTKNPRQDRAYYSASWRSSYPDSIHKARGYGSGGAGGGSDGLGGLVVIRYAL
ncbi:hypothetical protein UFOVP1566_4 [uncultured Caudovirales phage]|uniref:Glycine-rich domain-containing protein n=1 Tax=uncultured Caudovirales phage TaxID=2100421 RepID=A0A6J5S6A5_9CAUD|nr:hypothetical protein UFOVP1389_22 [uncultured Caudovirales phage]CAB5229602.1 hypothetical protein UFOVP1566_4 [uncultured Caudovirales phage]